MTDELYKCGSCGMEDPGTHMEYRIAGLPGTIREDELDAIAEILGINVPDIEADEAPRCDSCGEEYEAVFVSSSEIEYLDDDD